MSKCCVGRGGGTAENFILQFTVYIRYYCSTREFPPHLSSDFSLNTFLNQRLVFIEKSECTYVDYSKNRSVTLNSAHRTEDRSLTTCVCYDCGINF